MALCGKLLEIGVFSSWEKLLFRTMIWESLAYRLQQNEMDKAAQGRCIQGRSRVEKLGMC